MRCIIGTVRPGRPWPSGKNGASAVAFSGNGCVHAAFRYTALASTSLVSRLTAPDGSNPLILPAVCSAITRLIRVRAASGAAAKSASASVAAAWLSRAVNSARSGRPDCTHTVFGARNVADSLPGPPPRRADARRSALTATSSWRSAPSRCSARASSAAVLPRAPNRAIRSALATLVGEKTVSAASWASTWYMSTPNAATAAAAARASVSAAESFRTVPSYPRKVKP